MYERENRLTDNTELMNKQLTFNFLNQGLISEEVVQLQHRIETSTGNICVGVIMCIIPASVRLRAIGTGSQSG